MKNKLKAAVTGAGGFLGRRIALGLAEAGWTVYALTSKPETFKSDPKNIIPVLWNKNKTNPWPDALKRVDLCVHAAAAVDFQNKHLHELYQGNVFLTASLASFLAKKSQARMIYLSSVSVYGKDQKMSLKTQPIPDSHYGISKLLGEKVCLDALAGRCAILRLAGVWGNRDAKLFINQLIHTASQGKDLAIQGSGAGKRNYLWAGELEKIITSAWRKKCRGIRIAASREVLTIREMAEMIAGQKNVKLKRLPASAGENDSLAEVSPDLPEQISFSAALREELAL